VWLFALRDPRSPWRVDATPDPALIDEV